MAIKTIRNDLIPLRSGICRLIPLDREGKRMEDKAITTKRDFLTSMQIVTTRTSEKLPNGNGSDKDYPTDEKHNLTLITQTFDPKFNAVLSGAVTPSTSGTFLFDTSIAVPSAVPYEVTLTKTPVAGADGKFYFEVRDVYGNLYTKSDGAVAEGQYTYDDDQHKLTFDASAAGKTFSLVYYVNKTNYEEYATSPILKNPQFCIEIYAEMQSAESGETVKYFATMPRAVSTGDIPRAMSQKSVNSPITYTFSSAPVPQGMSALTEKYGTDE